MVVTHMIRKPLLDVCQSFASLWKIWFYRSKKSSEKVVFDPKVGAKVFPFCAFDISICISKIKDLEISMVKWQIGYLKKKVAIEI